MKGIIWMVAVGAAAFVAALLGPAAFGGGDHGKRSAASSR